VPVGFRYNPDEDAIEIGGHGGFSTRKKYRDVVHNPRVAFVVDDVPSVSPWTGAGLKYEVKAKFWRRAVRRWVQASIPR